MTITQRDGDFGVVHLRDARVCHVTTLQFSTGNYVHAVERALVEWMTGQNKLVFRYVLVCGDVRKQHDVHLTCSEKTKVTCPKCSYRTSQKG